MGCTRRSFLTLASGAALTGLVACAQEEAKPEAESVEPEAEAQPEPEEPKVDLKEFKKLALDPQAWAYDENNDVYYQLGVPYCLHPSSERLESLAIFVPGAYFKQVEDGHDTKLEIDEDAKVGDFTAKTAPVAMPINSGNLGPQTSPTAYGYAGLGTYLSAGFVYVYAGFRGRSSGYDSSSKEVFSGGAPWPVVGLKAAVRFLRYNAELLPCDVSRVFTFGFGMGGGVSALMGCTGGAEEYAPYLESIGAATHDAQGEDISDTVYGSASWCPVTSFDTADASYEWMMGQYDSSATRSEGLWTKLLSNDLARAYADYVNDMGLCDDEGSALTLDETSGELFADGTYYVRMLECLESAASAFLTSTPFPYTYTPQYLANANFAGDPNLQSEGTGATDVDAVTGDASAQATGTVTTDDATGGLTRVQSVVFNTPLDYVEYLNDDSVWLTYNQVKGTVRITSVGDFVRHSKKPAKDVCAFDDLARSSVENQLFGTDEAGTLHFSRMVCEQLGEGQESYEQASGWNDGVVEEWLEDLEVTDSLETPMDVRMGMFNPLHYLSGRYEGFGTAEVARHWRINTGLTQTDTSLCTEFNLALALRQYEGVKSVSFTPVWGQGHVLAETSGTAEENFVTWVRGCCTE